MIYSTLSMFSLKLHHCIKFYFLKTENNEKRLARTQPASICEQFDTCFRQISKHSSFKQTLYQYSHQQRCSVEIFTELSTKYHKHTWTKKCFFTCEWLCSWSLNHCSPAFKNIVGNMTLYQTNLKKNGRSIALSWSVVRKTFSTLSYRKTHQLSPASLWTVSNRSEFSLSWQK